MSERGEIEMRIRISPTNGSWYKMGLIYTTNEFPYLNALFERLGLRVATTNAGFGSSISLQYFRESHYELLNYINSKMTHPLSEYLPGYKYIDSINEEWIVDGRTINIAVFRVKPAHITSIGYVTPDIPSPNYGASVYKNAIIALQHAYNTIFNDTSKLEAIF